ncbi:MAG: class I SAM-dependent methyltransferase [Simkaniaceae bacterium]|nr:class I SAM-dependent methyltransferase [Simkaniaceae bacterium]
MILPTISDGEDKSSPLKNRIRKNYKHLRKWAKRTNTDCFRIYDRDIKEYPIAIDIYAGKFCVQYFSFDREDDELDTAEVDEILTSLFGDCQIYSRSRVRRRKFEQYEKRGENKEFFTALECGVKFKINLNDYLDTGLFLDHRTTRKLVAIDAKSKRLLNLFAYTCSFSVQAAMSGAAFTKSVDMSNTYTSWGRDNFELNHLSAKTHLIIRDDCLKFLDYEREKYDVIVIDPPTISRSKRMEEMFDVQKDYINLISKSLRLLEKGGVIYFSTNSRKFSFDKEVFSRCKIEEISHKTVPEDFHKKNIHRCWKIIPC